VNARGVRVGTILGIPIRVDYSWLVIVFLLTASIASGFGYNYPYLSLAARAAIGLSVSLMLFGSVLAHELSHAVVALRNRVEIRGIVLFIFGGAAEMLDEPKTAGAELRIAIAGPLMSLFLAAVFAGLYYFGLGNAPLPLVDCLSLLSRMNLVLVAFNVVPGFPLDGGRVLRAALWGIWGLPGPATRVASAVGSFFGTLLIVLGVLWFLQYQNFIGGLWFVLIGFFLRNAARNSYQQLVLRRALEGMKAEDVISLNAVSVAPGARLREVVEDVMAPNGISEVPVVSEDRLVGLLQLRRVRELGRDSWERQTASDVMTDPTSADTVLPTEDAVRVLARMGQAERWLPVVDESGRFLGIVTREELLRRLRLRLEILES
jgi:Zn-dependent protease/CBS domain-containing protein